MKGFELRLWRRELGWSQERAAEEMGMGLRTYIRHERQPGPVPAVIAHAATALTLRLTLPELAGLPPEILLVRLRTLLDPPSADGRNRPAGVSEPLPANLTAELAAENHATNAVK